VLRDNGDELIGRLKYTPYSRRLVEEIRTKTEFYDDIEELGHISYSSIRPLMQKDA